MRQKLRILLLASAILLGAVLLWTHWQRVDPEVDANIKSAENERHVYVISADFGLVKEKLIESHRDHWKAYATSEQEARWESAGILVLILILLVLLVDTLRGPHRLEKARE